METINWTSPETINTVAREFLLFCVNRNGKEWPAIYDEMCRVAGQRLFRGLGYAELRKLGLSLSLSHIDDVANLVDTYTRQS